MTSPADFDRLYAGDPDPWQVATSWYERRKIDITLASLRRRRHRLTWDAGCGIGELTAALARRSDRVVASDCSARAVELTRARTGDRPNVLVCESRLPDAPCDLDERPDLIVLSEVLYYLTPAERHATYDLVDARAEADADLVLIHWGPATDDARCSGLTAFNEASTALNARGWGRLVTHTDTEFLLGLFSRDVPDEVGGRDDDTAHNWR